MKRFYNFLSLFLLSLVGTASAVAQGFTQGDLLTSMDDIAGQQVIIASNHTGSDGTTGFMNGANDFISTPNDDCLYEFEATGNTADGYATYRLKQVSTGQYLKDVIVEDENEDYTVEYTAEAAEAYEFTSLPFVEGSTNVREVASSEKQDLSQVAFVFARAAKPAAYDAQYIGHLSRPFWSIYIDTNTWNIYSTVALTGKNKLFSYINSYYEAGAPNVQYTAGTAPGTYQAAAVEAAQAVYEEANNAYNAETFALTDAEVDDLCARIASTMKVLSSGEAYIGLSAGYYIITGSNNRFLTYGTYNGSPILATVTSYTVPDPLTATMANYIWKVEPTPSGAGAYIQNIVSNGYMTGNQVAASGSGLTDDGYIFGLNSQPDTIEVQQGGIAGAFLFLSPRETSGNGYRQYHSKYLGGIMSWNSSENTSNNFTFTPVSEEEALGLIEAARQLYITEQLSELYTTASSAYKSGLVFTSPGSADDNVWDAEGALVAATGDETTSNWFSNAKESTEGAYENLFDGDYTSFFHSAWSDGSFTPSLTGTYHYLGAELSEAISGALQIKMAKRVNGTTLIDYPTVVEIFGSNDVDKADPDAATWTDLGGGTMDWSGTMVIDGSTSYSNGIGYFNLEFEGSWKYIKIGVVGTDQGRGYFAISQCQIWQASQDGESEYMQLVPAEVKQALLDALATAKAAIDANNGTQETIDMLQEAYENFNNNLPDPARVTTAAAEAQEFLDAANEAGVIGTSLAQYSQESADALAAVLEEAAVFTGTSLTEISDMVNKINDALAAFKASLILPEAGKFYMLRSASTLSTSYRSGDGDFRLNSYHAPVYSPNSNASVANNVLRFSSLDGADSFTEAQSTAGDYSSLSDSINYAEDLRYLWKVESSDAGKITLRNMGTGMYLAAANGRAYQSAQPAELNLEGAATEQFLINAGTSEGSSTVMYVNAAGNEYITVWSGGTSDENNIWMFEEVDNGELDENISYVGVEVTPAQYTILTLPFMATPPGYAYNVVGVTDDNKLVLGQYDEAVPAATPFIYMPLAATTDELDHKRFESFVAEDLFDTGLGDGGEINFVMEPIHAEGLTGTLCKQDTLTQSGLGRFVDGAVAAAESGMVIGYNTGYLDATHQTGVDESTGTEVIELGNVVINSIDESTVVVLPSKVNVYSLNGMLLRKDVKSASATKGLPAGIYIVGGQKVLVK